jgi:hypothetical protein
VLVEVLTIHFFWNVRFSRKHWRINPSGMLVSQEGTGDSSLLECYVFKEVLVIRVFWNVRF